VKKTSEQLPLGLAGGGRRPPNRPERRLEVHCSNCGARFVAYYGSDEEANYAVDVKSCGLCHCDEYRRGNFKGATSV
jgi:hypothetical protein